MSQVILGNQKLRFIKSMFYMLPLPPEYLTIEALEDEFYIAYIDVFYEMGYTDEDIQMVCNETGWEYEKMQYSFDKINWYILEPYEPTPPINAGEKIYLKRRFITPGLYKEIHSPLTYIFCEYQYNLSGNCNSILFGDSKGELFDYCFFQLFTNSGAINVSPNFLPAVTLAEGCYSGMFKECPFLVTAPELPATTLADSCCANMFEGCTSLVTAPSILPATTLIGDCYYRMFAYCSSLITTPALPATTLTEYCYGEMFHNCTSLVNAPALPATTLVGDCYREMFSGCTKLNYIKALFTTTPSTSYTENWVKGVSSTGTFIKNANATWNVNGVNGIPAGWVVRTA